jgi:radical SAM superfamily enzyme YgiQ (UPF0313 family)
VRSQKLRVIYIRPSRYDDDGYVVRYWRGVLPSNTLACLKTLTLAVAESGELGDDVEVSVEIYDDSVQRVPVGRIVRRGKRGTERTVVGFAGVQTNQFARASELALQFREAGIPVLIGGFHVSGILAMFDEPSPELRMLLDRGVSLVPGEAESPGLLAGILRDALVGEMKPIYNSPQLPDITDAPIPQPDCDYLRRFVLKNMGTIDTSRGCPFDCSFCTIINVQGHKMRCRSAPAMLKSIEENHDRGVNLYFFTDDNLSRSPVWEELFDGLIRLRSNGKRIRFMMQIDTQAFRLPRFVSKAAAAGCYLVFVGMESINEDNLAAMGKRQNKVQRYAEMVETWHRADILVQVGYIIGLPYDTPESVRREVEILRREIKVDDASFFMLIPLPGSQDHFQMVRDRVPIDEDLNGYDSCHETFSHPNFAPGGWLDAYHEAWEAFYSKESVTDELLRTSPGCYWQTFRRLLWNRYSTLIRTHPMVTGLFRLKDRTSRRSHFARESIPRYLWRRVSDASKTARVFGSLFFEFQEIWLLTRKREDPRWALLADLRARWAQVQQQISETEVAAGCDAAAQELRSMLASASDRLMRLGETGKSLSGGVRARLQAKAHEIEEYLDAFEIQIPTWRRVFHAERFVRESLLAGYEELAIRSVAKRRQLNAYRRDLIDKLKSGRVLTPRILSLPRVLIFELLLGVRFGFAFFSQIQRAE